MAERSALLHRVIGSAAGGFDRAINAVIVRRTRAHASAAAENLGHRARMHWLDRVDAIYGRPEHFVADGDVFYPRHGALDVGSAAVGSYRSDGRVVDLRWSSRSRVFLSDVRATYHSVRENQTVRARVFLHNDRPRPAIVLIHGYMGGAFALEERVWPLSWLFELGLDVALAVLPFHGPRMRRGAAPLFPGPDPRLTVEAFRQAIVDLRDLLDWFRARGSSEVGAMGMSLGGYTTSLLATVDPELSFAFPMIPLASIALIARDQGRLVGTDAERQEQFDALEKAHAAVSPVIRTPRLAGHRVRVFAAEYDQITPHAHARRIADHFDAPLEVFSGGHMLQVGRGAVFRSVARTLGELGVIERRGSR